MISLHKKIVVLSYLFEEVCASGEPAKLSLQLPLKMLCGIQTHLLSIEINGKDRRIICTQNRTLAYALHAIGKCKLMLFIRNLMRQVGVEQHEYK